MSRRLLLVLVLASAVGLIASGLVYRVLSQAALGHHEESTQNIVVAAVNMSMAETITPQHVKLVAWPARSVPSGWCLPAAAPALPDAAC